MAPGSTVKKTNHNKMKPGVPGTRNAGDCDKSLDEEGIYNTGLTTIFTPVFPNSVLVCQACWTLTTNFDTHTRVTSSGVCGNHRAIKHVWQCCHNNGLKQQPSCHVLRGMIEGGHIFCHEIMAQGANWNPMQDPLQANPHYPVRATVVGRTLVQLKNEYLQANPGITDEDYPDVLGRGIAAAPNNQSEQSNVVQSANLFAQDVLEKAQKAGPDALMAVVGKFLPALVNAGKIVEIPDDAPDNAQALLHTHLNELRIQEQARKRTRTTETGESSRPN